MFLNRFISKIFKKTNNKTSNRIYNIKSKKIYNKTYKFIKILFILLIMLALLNMFWVFTQNNVNQISANKISFLSNPDNIIEIEAEQGVNSLETGGFEFLKTLGTGIVSIIMFLLRALVVLVLEAAHGVITLAVKVFGGGDTPLSIENILFNKIELINLNFMTPQLNVMQTFSQSISSTFRAVMSLAIVLQLIVLLFVAIKGIIRAITVPEYSNPREDSDMKRILTNWLKGVGLLFVLAFIIIAVINVNNALVKAFEAGLSPNDGYEQVTQQVRDGALSFNVMHGTISLILYAALRIQAYALFIKYVSRAIKVAFLIMIAPAITVTYSIDKIGDGTAQAFNKWLTIFMQTILIQIAHIIIYASIVGLVINTNGVQMSFGGLLLAIAAIRFIWDGEKIIYNLFNISSGKEFGLQSAVQTLARGAQAEQAIKLARKVKGTKSPGQKSTLDTVKGKLEESETGKKVLAGAEKVTKSKPVSAVTDTFTKGKEKITDVKDSVQNKMDEVKGKVYKNIDKITEKPKAFQEFVEDNIDDAKLRSSQLYRQAKTKIYDLAKLKAPKKRYEEELKKKKKNLKLRRVDQRKKREDKKLAKRKQKRFRRAAVGGVAGVTTGVVKTVTSSAGPGKIYASARGAKRTAQALLVDKEEEKEKSENKDKKKITPLDSNVTKSSREYVQMEKELTTENYVNLTNKQNVVSSSTNLDLTTTEGQDNYKSYIEGIRIAEKVIGEDGFKSITKQAENKYKKFLKNKEQRTEKEIEQIISLLKDTVENNRKLKTEHFNNETKEYINALIDNRQAEIVRNFEEKTKYINADYNDLTNNMLYLNSYDSELKEDIDEEEELDIDFIFE